MRLRQILIYSVATATVALTSATVTPVIDVPSVARAETNVSVSVNTFYEDLAPHGSWVSYRESYVFVPRVEAEWRPYTVGHWVSTKRYGWMWVSDEPFGWATYHYGRWGYADDIGWYWVPGKRWAPAWVAWRRSGDHVVWAPLPPDGDDVSVEVRIEEIPDIYWVAVPARSFLEVNLATVIIDDDNERVRIVEAAEPVGSVTIENNVVVNTVIDVDYVEKATQKKVETVEVKETDDPKQAGKESEGQLSAFTGEVKEEGDAKPAEVKDVEEVKKERAAATGGTEGQTPGSEQSTGTQGEDQTGQSATSPDDQTGKKKKTTGEPAQSQDGQPTQAETEEQKGKATGEAEQAEEAQPEQGQDQPVKKKSKATEQSEEPDATQAEQGQDQPVKKKSKATEQSEEPDATQAEQGQDQPVKKKKSQATEESPQPEQGQGQPPKKKQKAAPEEPAQKPEGCDPATGQNC